MILFGKISFFLFLLLTPAICQGFTFSKEKGKEETYSIFLTKTAEGVKKQQTYMVGEKKFLTETYTIKRGECIWKIFRDRGLLKRRDLPDLIAALKSLNSSLKNIDLIYPGQKIIIPLPIDKKGELSLASRQIPIKTIDVDSVEDIEWENYRIKPGDSLIRVIEARYHIPKKYLYDEYLNLVRKLNPFIQDLNIIHPGQLIRLPICSHPIVRKAIEPARLRSKRTEQISTGIAALRYALGRIFTEIGEEWIQTGEHVIPFKAGGQIKLKADSYPIISLSNGVRVIVDLYNDLPEKVAHLIRSSWKSYRIVHLKNDDLRMALDKILRLCDYHKVYKRGEPVEIKDDISIQITADWIIKPTSGQSSDREKFIMITLMEGETPKTPQAIKGLLGRRGIKVIDYPSKDEPLKEPPAKIGTLNPGDRKTALVEMLLNLTGQQFSKKIEIPLYQSQKRDLTLIVKADYSLNIKGRDCIIDLTGLGQDIISMLHENQFSVLSLAGENNPSSIVSKTLNFLGVEFDSKPLSFMATNRDSSRNIKLIISGIIFHDYNSQTVLATELRIPKEIISLLAKRGYTILNLPL